MTAVHWQSTQDLATAVRSGQLSAREVVQAHLERIERLNPHVNAVVTLVAEQALEQAAAADEQLASGAEVGPLHGIPIAHKDTHATSGIRTTSGSPILRDRRPKRDELIVERLRSAGATTRKVLSRDGGNITGHVIAIRDSRQHGNRGSRTTGRCPRLAASRPERRGFP